MVVNRSRGNSRSSRGNANQQPPLPPLVPPNPVDPRVNADGRVPAAEEQPRVVNEPPNQEVRIERENPPPLNPAEIPGAAGGLPDLAAQQQVDDARANADRLAERDRRFHADLEHLRAQNELLASQMASLVEAVQRMPSAFHPGVDAADCRSEEAVHPDRRTSSPARSPLNNPNIPGMASPASNRPLGNALHVPDSTESNRTRTSEIPTAPQAGMAFDPLALLGSGAPGIASGKLFGVQLQTFSGVGFHTWSHEVERLFTVLGWINYIRYDMPANFPGDEEIKTLDLKIGLVLDSHIAAKIKEELDRKGDSAFHIWSALTRWYRAESIARRNDSFEKLMNLRMTGRNIEDYLTQFRKVTNEIRSKSTSFEDLFKYVLLRGLGREGESLQQAFANSSLSAGELAAEIHDRFNSHKTAAAVFTNRYSSTLSTRANSKSKGDRRKHSPPASRSPQRKTPPRPPSDAIQMSSEQKERYRSTVCNLCNQVGHPINFCYKLNTVKVNAVLTSGSDSDSDYEENEHVALGLVFIDDQLDQEDPSKDSEPPLTHAVLGVHDLAEPVLQTTRAESLRDRFIFDTGASVHICNDRKWFLSMKPSVRRFRTSNEGSILVAEGVGTVSIVLDSGNQIIVEEVYFCPNACQNLLTNIGLNKTLQFHVDYTGVIATLTGAPEPFRFAEIKNRQNVICAIPPLSVNFVTRSGREPTSAASRGREGVDDSSRGRGDTVVSSRGRTGPRPTRSDTAVRRPRGRPKKVAKTPLPEVPQVPAAVAEDHVDSEPEDNSDEYLEDYFPMDSDVEDPEAIELEKEFLNEDFVDDPLVIGDEVSLEDEPLKEAPALAKSNAVWREAAKRVGLRNAYDVHIACGHSGQSATKRTCQMYGVKFTPFNCEICRIHNQVHTVNRRPRLSAARYPLEIVYVDFCQPFGRLPAYDGSTVAMVIHDEFTGFSTVYCLENRSQWLEFFKMYVKKAERRHNRKLIEIRTDNAREFESDEAKLYEANEGIVHSFTTPYIHENAAHVERLNRTLEEKAIKLLAAAGLSNRYWSEAILYAGELYNRTVNYKSQIPFTNWFGKVCDRKRLPFGIPVVYLRYSLQGKPRRGKAIFFGFARNRKAYRIQADEENFVREDVYFVKPLVAHPHSPQNSGQLNDYDEFVSAICSINPEDDQLLVGDQIHQLEFLAEVHCAVQSVLESDTIQLIPRRYSEIAKISDPAARLRWIQATRNELNEMVQNNVFTLVQRSEATTKPIGTQYVYSIKEGTERARLVARGDWQSIETYGDTYAPTLSVTILRMLLKIAINEDLEVHNFDVRRAFLKSPINEDVYLELPEGYHLINPKIAARDRRGYLLRLNRALYGLKQSGRQWHETISAKLIEFGFIPLARAPTVFVHRSIARYYIAVYVDDLITIAPDTKLINEVRKLLTNAFDIHDRGPLTRVLGIDIERTDSQFKLSLTPMIKALCLRYDICGDGRTSTPLAAGDIPDAAPNAEAADYIDYLSLLGSLLYIARMIRPDILVGIVQLSQFASTPKQIHHRRLLQILRYLFNTAEFSLRITKSDDFKVEIYVDSSLGNAHDRKSLSGSAVYMGQSLVSYTSKKSDLIAQSSNEAEVIAASEGLRDLLFARFMVCGLLHRDESDDLSAKEKEKCDICETPVLYVDNTGVLAFVNKGYGRRTKHLEIRHAALVDYAQKKFFVPRHVESAANPADSLTKNLRFITLQHQRKLLGITA